MNWLDVPRSAVAYVVIVVLALVAIAAIVALVLYVRHRRASSDAAQGPKSATLVSAWRAFKRSLERPARGRPVAFILGPAGSGKTSLVTRGALGDRIESVASEHPSASFYAARGWLAIELAWEAFRDLRADAVAQRDALIDECGWQVNALVVVLDATTPLSRDALAALGEQIGALSARVERSRRAPVSVRVCWTHLDIEFAGFEALSTAIAAQHEGLDTSPHRVLSVPIEAPMSATEARAAFEPLASLWPYALQAPNFSEVLAFCSRGHERLMGPLVPFCTGVLRRASEGAATLDGVAFAALAPTGPSTEFGDALRADAKGDVALARARRLAWAVRIAVSAVLASALGAVLWMGASKAKAEVGQVQRESSAFAARVARGERGASLQQPASSAAAALLGARALSNTAAYRSARRSFLTAVQDGNLRPLVASTNPSRRALGVAMLRSSPGDATRARVRAQLDAWSLRGEIPADVLSAYMTLNAEPTSVGAVSPPENPVDTWSRFVRSLGAATDPPSLDRPTFEQAQRDAVSVAAINGASTDDEATRGLIESLRQRGEPVDQWFVSSSPSDPWRAPAAQQLMAAVAATDLSTPVPAQPTLQSLLRTTEPLALALGGDPPEAAAPPSASSADAAIGPGSTDASAPAQDPRQAQWLSAVARYRSAAALEAWVTARRQSQDPMGTFFVAGECGASFGQSVVPNRGASHAIPCEFAPAPFNAAAVAPREQLATLLRALSLPVARESEVSNFVATESAALEVTRNLSTSQYADHYAFRCDSVEVLASDFAIIVGPGSYLRSYLIAISRVLSAVDPSLQGELASLAAIGATNAAGATPVLEPYLAILRPIMASISALRPSAVPPNTPLAERTAPIGTLALQMLQGGETSAWTKASAWLDAQGVSQRLRRPLMAPIECAYQLGITEAERVLAQIYAREMAPSARRVWARFPFDSTATQEADPAEVEALFAPHGSFWTAVEANFSTVAEVGAAGRWRSRRGPNGREFTLPSDSCCALTRAGRTKTALWSSEGARTPLALEVHSAPLPLSTSGYTPTLVSLRSGDRSISAFNQAELWQRLAVAWGDGGNSGIVVHLMPVGGGASQLVTMDRGPSDWSFHRLLADGQNETNRTLRRTVAWTVRSPNGRPVNVSFEFRSDPWLPFLAPSGCEGANQ
ncbi:MAG: hypothetical protein Q8Q09_25880 [Deltaproteobacteria bacterium]|nr:hypothetical protein [Deltaproteobacteria bacterium]